MTATSTWRMPGRIEVLGKHTDYGGGRVLVCAADRDITLRGEEIAGAPGTLEAETAEYPGLLRLTAGAEPALPAGHWGHYLHTVLTRLTANFGPLRAARLTITSDLPPASGMSSSSAIISAAAMVLADLNELTSTPVWAEQIPDRMALAGYAASIENGKTFGSLLGRPGVGTSGGSLDHTGMLAGRDGMLSYVEFDPMRTLDRVALPQGWTFVVAVSGVLAEKTGAAQEAYNRGPALLNEIVQRWNRSTGRTDLTLQSVVRSLVGEALDGPLTDEIGTELGAIDTDERLRPLRVLAAEGAERNRLDQFLVESGVLVPRGTAELGRGDLDAFAATVATSQALAETHLGNQVPQTVDLVAGAGALGAQAASAFGAGFGGSVWALVPAADADGFAADWMARYRASGEVTDVAKALVVRPGAPGAPVVGVAA